MTDDERAIAAALHSCSFLPASFDKRFARDMNGLATASPDKELTEKQVATLYGLLYKYRRQIPNTYAKHQYNPLCVPRKKQLPQPKP